MNAFINAPLSTDAKRSDMGFLIALLILVLLQFLLFYYGVPKFTSSFYKTEAPSAHNEVAADFS